jgi:beta-glucosidase
MTAYNKVNGAYCSENVVLVRKILKDEWRYDGYVVSDWVFGTHSTVPALEAGLDLEMPFGNYFGVSLQRAVENEEASELLIDDAVRRILRKKFTFGLDTPREVDADVVECKEHTDLALEVERKAIVLLKNHGVLPLTRGAGKRVVVLGELADVENLGDTGSSYVAPSYVVTPLEGIRNRSGEVEVVHMQGTALRTEDLEVIATADAAVVVTGLTVEDEGELMPGRQSADRDTLDLSTEQEALIVEVAAANDNTIVVLEGGSAITMSAWVDEAAAILMAWYPGLEGGHAIADVLFGDVNPSGKLPITFPATQDQLPEFIHDQDAVTYGYFHGYRWVDLQEIQPAYPFGYGLSYTTFAYDNLQLSDTELPPDGTLAVSLDVTNTGGMAGEEIVQLYIGYEGSSVERPVRELRGFTRVQLEAAEARTVSFDLAAADLGFFDVDAGAWRVEPITYRVFVGASSRDLPLVATFEVTR